MPEPTERTQLTAPKGDVEKQAAAPAEPLQPAERMSARAWIALATLVLLNILNHADRNLISSFANFIMPELGLSNTQLGLLTGFAFTAIMAVVMGAVTDCVNRPRLIALAMILWSVLTATSGAAHSFYGLLVPRIFVGVGEAVLGPAALALIGDLIPSSHIAMATGCFGSATTLGFGFSLLLAGQWGEELGWRWAFLLLGGTGLVLAPLVPCVVAEPRGYAARPTFATMRRDLVINVKAAVRLFRGCGALRYAVGGLVALGIIIASYSYIQPWLTAERGFERADAAFYTGLVLLTVGTVANPAVGAVADFVSRKTELPRFSFAAYLLLCAQLPIGVCFFLILDASDRTGFWLLMGLWVFSCAVYGPVISAFNELCPPQLRGTVLGLSMFLINFVGVGVGNLVVGVTVDGLTRRGWRAPYTATLACGLVLSTLLMTTFFFIAGAKYKSDVRWVATLGQQIAREAEALKAEKGGEPCPMRSGRCAVVQLCSHPLFLRY